MTTFVSGAMKMRGMKMIRVYFERGYASEEVAMFHDEETYLACIPTLKKLAKEQNWERVTESVGEIDNE